MQRNPFNFGISRRTLIKAAGASAAVAAVGLPGRLKAADPLKVAAIYTVPVEQQWVSRIHKAANAAKERGDIEYVYSENTANNDYERVMREYCEAGHKLILGEVFGVEDAARAVARDDDDLPPELHPHLCRPKHMSGRMQADLDAVDVAHFAIGQLVPLPRRVLAVARLHDGDGVGRRQHRPVARPRMVGMAMRDDGARHRPQRIDRNVAAFDVKMAVEQAHGGQYKDNATRMRGGFTASIATTTPSFPRRRE